MKKIKELINSRDFIIFDMDGVIINSEPLKAAAYQKVFIDKFGINIDHNDISWRGKPEPYVIKYLLNRHNIDSQDIQELIQLKRLNYKESLEDNITLIEGIRDFLSYLKDQNKTISLATTSNKAEQTAIFKLFDLEPYFTNVLTLDDITQPKPHPEIYLKMLDILNADKANCLVFEDTPSGVMAANKAGLEAVCVLSSYKKDDFSGCEYFIKDFNELLIPEIPC